MKQPKFLNKTGKAKWRELVAHLPDLKQSEYDSLALLCASWEDFLHARDAITEAGHYLKSDVNGRCFINPAINERNEAWKQIVKLSKGFGLEPTKRAATIVSDDDAQWSGILEEGEE